MLIFPEFQFMQEIKKRVYNYTLAKMEQYNKDAGVVDIPECYKLHEDKLTTKVAAYVDRLVEEGRLYEVYTKEILYT